MSSSGVYSNRGDCYQKYIAFDWVLSLLEDSEYEWLEVDSIKYREVDDVVIGKKDGSIICCQCKKNQPQHKNWTFSDLKYELKKSIICLIKNKKCKVYFYSQTAFGELSKLKEKQNILEDESSFHLNIPKNLKIIYSQLDSLVQSVDERFHALDILPNLYFECTNDVSSLDYNLHKKLQRVASNSEAAFSAIWTMLDLQSARINQSEEEAGNIRITKCQIHKRLATVGSVICLPINLVESRQKLNQMSRIGRMWKRDINGQRIDNPIVNHIIEATEMETKSIILTGGPGSGKTCVLLEIQDRLEEISRTQNTLIPIFIQTRDYADCENPEQMETLGLPIKLHELVARIADETYCVVIFDSLDVLSIARSHYILTYFLHQIDLLLELDNVSVITSCRTFDMKYDTRIALRQWDKEFECRDLDWTDQVAPLLDSVGYPYEKIAPDTKELIKNPRELDLFIELFLHKEVVHSITSNELVQQYIRRVILENPFLGSKAIEALEDIALEMLVARKLTIPRSRFKQSKLLPILLSNNILREVHNEMLTLGHQTLLDALIVRKMDRDGISLATFMKDLPPVPFVRPSIRSYMMHLANKDRARYRRQIREVFSGNHPFHLNRLVAETFSQEIPIDSDWPMLKYLWDDHKEIFRIIYNASSKVEWFDFFAKHFVPLLNIRGNNSELLVHAYKIRIWANKRPQSVLQFWKMILEKKVDPDNQFLAQLVFFLAEVEPQYAEYLVPFIDILQSNKMERHYELGEIIATCMNAKVIPVSRLWQYIVADVKTEEIEANELRLAKLHCRPYEFGAKNETFLTDWMLTSEELLDSAIASIEEWYNIICRRYTITKISKLCSFLHYTSYEDSHTQTTVSAHDEPEILFEAIELSIKTHAETDSTWWHINKQKLAQSKEASLLYFLIKGCLSNPLQNITIASQILSNKEFLTSDLSYELGLLMKETFIYMDKQSQEKVLDSIAINEYERITQAQYISCIPVHIRPHFAQQILDAMQQKIYPIMINPDIHSLCGFVCSPFSFQIFLYELDDEHVLQVLQYYAKFERGYDHWGLEGGKKEVGGELQQAASRAPFRFLDFVFTHLYEMDSSFVTRIISGIVSCIEYLFGNQKTPEGWEIVEEGDIQTIHRRLLTLLEKFDAPNEKSHEFARTLLVCAKMASTTEDAYRVVFLSLGFRKLDPDLNKITGDVDFLTEGINDPKGIAGEALIILANRLIEQDIQFPDILLPAISGFIREENKGVRAAIVNNFHYFLYYRPESGWLLFEKMMEHGKGLWVYAEYCLYHTYNNYPSKVLSFLDQIFLEGNERDFKTWGQISALCVLSEAIAIETFLQSLDDLNSEKAWEGAVKVFTHSGNFSNHKSLCILGIQHGLQSESGSIITARCLGALMRDKELVFIPIELIEQYLNIEIDRPRGFDNGIVEWLNKMAQFDIEFALEGLEKLITYALSHTIYLSNYHNHLTQLLTKLFGEAEERESIDNAEMLHRVVEIQDKLITIGVSDIYNWLKEAERP